MKHLLRALYSAAALTLPATAAPLDSPGLLQITAASGKVSRISTDGQIEAEVGLPVTSQTFAPYAGSGAWLLTPGVAMRVPFSLPEGATGAALEVDELGWLDNPEGSVYLVQVGGAAVTLPAAAPRALVSRTVDLDLGAGANEILISNNAPGARIGIVSVTVTYRSAAPAGEGKVRTATGDEAQVEAILLGPTPGQQFDRGKGIPIEWDTRGFPEGTGIAIHWRSQGSSWQTIPDAEGLPFNHPFGTGTRGAYLWTPSAPVEDVEFGLSYVARGRRDPMRITVGGEDGLATIKEAMDRAREGDTIVLAPGTYHETVRIPVSLSLVGADRDRVTLSSSARLAAVTVPEGVTARIAHLTVDCTPGQRKRHGATGFEIAGSAHIEQVRVRAASAAFRCRGESARLDQVETQDVSTALEATSGTVDARGLQAKCRDVAVRVTNRAQCTIRDSSFQSGFRGASAHGPGTSLVLSQVTLEGGGATATTDRGAAAYRGASVRVNGGAITRFGGSGVWSEHKGSRLEARGVRIAGNNLYGMGATGEGTMVLRNCTLASNNKGGFTLEGASPSSVIDCKITGNRGWAGTSRDSHGSTFTGNRVSGNENNTLWSDNRGRSTFRNNVED